MDVIINEMSSTVRTMDSQAMLHPQVLERIIQQHLIEGRVVEEYCFARNPLK